MGNRIIPKQGPAIRKELLPIMKAASLVGKAGRGGGGHKFLSSLLGWLPPGVNRVLEAAERSSLKISPCIVP